jgi:hypothetical protein
MILDRLRISADEFAAGTGWKLEPRGACFGEMCVPLTPEASGAASTAGDIDVESVAERLGMALVADRNEGIWALGPATVSGRALASAKAPELTLQTFDGEEFRLSSLLGQRVVMVAWSPY